MKSSTVGVAGSIVTAGSTSVQALLLRPLTERTLRRGTISNEATVSLPGRRNEQGLISKLARLGYDGRPLAGKADTWVFVDTQTGALFGRGLMLYSSLALDSWCYAWAPEREEDRELRWPKLVELLATTGPGAPVLEARLDEKRWRLHSASAHSFVLVLHEWSFSDPLGGRARGDIDLLSVECENGPMIDGEYFLVLLEEALGCTQVSQSLLELGLSSCHLPLPGAPYPKELTVSISDTVSAACRKIVSGQIYKLKANVPGALLGLHSGFVHDVRVACRRLRFALKVFSPIISEEAGQQARRFLADAARFMGAIRDIDVQLEKLPAQLEAVNAPVEFRKTICASYARRREGVRVKARAELDSEEFFEFLDALHSKLDIRHDKVGASPIGDFANRRIEEVFKGLTKWTVGHRGNPRETDFHRIRILCKKLRYIGEFFLSVGGEPLEKVVSSCIQLQDCLGIHQDATVAIETLIELSRDPALADRAAMLSLGSLIQLYREARFSQALQFEDLWRNLKKAARHWTKARSRRTAPDPASMSTGQ